FYMSPLIFHLFFACSFFFTHTSSPVIYTLSLHDALPISSNDELLTSVCELLTSNGELLTSTCELLTSNGKLLTSVCKLLTSNGEDRKSTRLNSSHVSISYAVFCLKKKIKKK